MSEASFVWWRDRRLWVFLIALAAATVAQGVGTKLVIRLLNGSLASAALPGVALLVGAYGLLVVGLLRMLRGGRPGRGSPGPGPMS